MTEAAMSAPPAAPRSKSPDEIRQLRARHPEMRERDFSRIHGISEAELVAAYVGDGVTRLRVDVPATLEGLKTLGTVMALTRNESAEHEKIGPYEKVSATNAHAALVLGEQIDLRIFPQKWAFAFAVDKSGDSGVKRSLQFFDAHGDAVHKVHLRSESDEAAFLALVESLRATEQSGVLDIAPPSPAERSGEPADHRALREHWDRLTDTHQFFPMLRKLNLSRHEAIHMIDRDYAWPLPPGAVAQLMNCAAGSPLPIMVFVGNRGCIQIHSGPIEKVSEMGPWLNVLDETFHLHLRADHITEAWAVRKPVTGGRVTSVEAYDSNGEMIIQFFGERQEGVDERPGWRGLVEGLDRAQEHTSA